jgi:rhodanese-related sulfurtransferase
VHGDADALLAGMMRRAAARIDRLTPARAAAEMAAGAVLVDIRTGQERAERGTVPGAVVIERTKLEWRVAMDSDSRHEAIGDRGTRVVLICHEGYASLLAAATLRDLGFARATDVVGGVEGWRAAGLPVDPPAAPPGP